MRARGAILALLALLAPGARAQQDNTFKFRTVAQVDNWVETGRMRPPVVLPPSGDTVEREWRMVLADGVSKQPASSIWNTIKSGGIVKTAGNLARGGGRMIVANAPMAITTIGINAALQAFFNSVKSGATASNELSGCLANDGNAGVPITWGATCYTVSSPSTKPVGPWPKPAPDKTIALIVDGGARKVSVYATGSPNGVDMYLRSTCGGNGQNSYSLNSSNVAYYDDYVNSMIDACWAASMQQTPVTLRDVIDGGMVGNQEIPARPQIQEEVKQALVDYYRTTPPNLNKGQDELWPGVTFEIKPTINEYYGTPVDPDQDLDNDSWSDGEEIPRGSDPSDPNSVPDPSRDTDGDGVSDQDEEKAGTNPYDAEDKPLPDYDKDGTPDNSDPDDDNDGATDIEEAAAGTNPKDATSKPETPADKAEEEAIKDCKSNGGTWNATNKVCENNPDNPTTNDCGNFGITRLLKFPGSYIKDVVFPCEDPADMIKPITELLKTKFPFSLAAGLNGWFKAPLGGDSPSQMPTKLGIIPLDWGWLAPLWATIKTIVGVALWAWFIYWVIDRFTPRAQI